MIYIGEPFTVNAYNSVSIHQVFLATRMPRFFNRYDDQCIAATIASVTHLHFKLRWLHKKFQTKSYIDHIRELLVTKATELSVQNNTMDSDDNNIDLDENANRGEFCFYTQIAICVFDMKFLYTPIFTVNMLFFYHIVSYTNIHRYKNVSLRLLRQPNEMCSIRSGLYTC